LAEKDGKTGEDDNKDKDEDEEDEDKDDDDGPSKKHSSKRPRPTKQNPYWGFVKGALCGIDEHGKIS
jgi:hypothetical protein